MGKIQPRELPGRAAKRFKAQKIGDFVKFLLGVRSQSDTYKPFMASLYLNFFKHNHNFDSRRWRRNFVQPSIMVRKM